MGHVAAGALGGAVLRLLAVGVRLLLRVAVRLLWRHALRGLLGVAVTGLTLRLPVRAGLLTVGPGLLRLLAPVRTRLVVAHLLLPLTGRLCVANILAEAVPWWGGGGHTVTEQSRFGTRPSHP
ncbi:hypothetical protein SNE510_03590 [Streptomyces sp. NE5-10]|nr:hypothetical protein SNE510_03590 [Streptomyces sp. NE5-10]